MNAATQQNTQLIPPSDHESALCVRRAGKGHAVPKATCNRLDAVWREIYLAVRRSPDEQGRDFDADLKEALIDAREKLDSGAADAQPGRVEQIIEALGETANDPAVDLVDGNNDYILRGSFPATSPPPVDAVKTLADVERYIRDKDFDGFVCDEGLSLRMAQLMASGAHESDLIHARLVKGKFQATRTHERIKKLAEQFKSSRKSKRQVSPGPGWRPQVATAAANSSPIVATRIGPAVGSMTVGNVAVMPDPAALLARIGTALEGATSWDALFDNAELIADLTLLYHDEDGPDRYMEVLYGLESREVVDAKLDVDKLREACGGAFGFDESGIDEAIAYGFVRKTLPGLFNPGVEVANPHRLAELVKPNYFRHLRHWQDEFHEWNGRSYTPLPKNVVVKLVNAAVADIVDQEHAIIEMELRKFATMNGDNNPEIPPKTPVGTKLVGDVVQALAGLAHLNEQIIKSQPAWIGEAPNGWAADEMLSCRNGLVHLPTVARDQPAIITHTPNFFHTVSVNYNFDPAATAPTWETSFLPSVWPKDPTSILALQEWFGYMLTPDTRHHKIAMLICEPRSGKGTIVREMEEMLGLENVVHPTIHDLGTPFGKENLIGKPAAVIGDARIDHRTDVGSLTETLLTISGGDGLSVPRKYRAAWTGKLPVRFVILSNMLPRLPDSSAVIVSRMLMFRFTESFMGREDKDLDAKLVAELPGVLNWAIKGWARLREQKRFTEPASGLVLKKDMEEVSAPLKGFMRDVHAVADPTGTVEIKEFFNIWNHWVLDNKAKYEWSTNQFGLNLRSIVPDIERVRVTVEGRRTWHYKGIRIRSPQEILDSEKQEAGDEESDDLPF